MKNEEGPAAEPPGTVKSKEMKKTYGLPYKGSKNRFAEQIVAILPRARHLYDLFAGGGAISHCAMQTRRWEVIHANDINGAQMEFLKDALDGRVPMRVVTRAEFEEEKGHDMMVASCYSFGGGGEDYLWSKKIERVKQIGVKMLLAESLEERVELYRSFGKEVKRMAYEMVENKECVDQYRQTVDKEKIEAAAEIEAFGVKDGNYEVWGKGNRRTALLSELVEYFCTAKEKSGLKAKQIDEALGNCMGSHYFTRGSQWSLPKKSDYEILQKIMDLPEQWEVLKAKNDGLLEGWEESSAPADWDTFSSFEKLEALDNMLRVKAMKSTKPLAELQTTAGDYRDVEILPDSVIYCDIPYIGMRGDTDNTAYNEGKGGMTAFDHAAFYDWAERQSVPVFISSYDMPRDRFAPVLEIKTICSFAACNSNVETWERVFMPIGQVEAYREAQRLQKEIEWEE